MLADLRTMEEAFRGMQNSTNRYARRRFGNHFEATLKNITQEYGGLMKMYGLVLPAAGTLELIHCLRQHIIKMDEVKAQVSTLDKEFKVNPSPPITTRVRQHK